MTLVSSAVITIVVWAISLLPSARLQALVYSLPLPMTVVLVATDVRVGGTQIVGVALLCAFFFVVTLAYRRLRLHILLADAVGAGCYVVASCLLALTPEIPLLPAALATGVAWAGAVLVFRRLPRARHDRDHDAPQHDAPQDSASQGGAQARGDWHDRRAGAATPAGPVRFAVVFAAAFSILLVGQAMNGFVVTFPYSGVLVAIEARHHLPGFSRHFARNSIALVAFLLAVGVAQDLPGPAALAAGWVCFLVTVAAVNAPDQLRGRRIASGRTPPRPTPGRSACRD